MLKRILTPIFRRKNPAFTFDAAVNDGVVLEFAFAKMRAYLRGWRLHLYGAKVTKIFLGRGVKFHYLQNIRFGRLIQLEDHVCISALGKGKVTLGGRVRIGAFSRLVTSTTFDQLGSHITIGDNVGIGEFAYLGGAGGLDIGADCIIGQYFSCHPENHVFTDENELIRLQGTTRQGIRIGKNCWIGAKVTILDGVNIGDDCVVAAGAVVTKSMPAGCVIGGVPARVIKMRGNWTESGNSEIGEVGNWAAPEKNKTQTTNSPVAQSPNHQVPQI